MGSTPDTEFSLCTAWMAPDLAKVQPWTRIQEFGKAMLRIRPLLPSPHLSMTASSTTYIRKISTVANLIMSLPFSDNRLCLLKSFLFAIVLHPVSSTSCFYILLSFSQAKTAIVAAWKNASYSFSSTAWEADLWNTMKQIWTILYKRIFPSFPTGPAFSVSTGRGVSLFMWARALLKTRL